MYMHNRKEILINQKKFNREIVEFLKKDFLHQKNELNQIETEDEFIIKEKKKLEKKFDKIDVKKEINKFFINENNLYPKFYAWWDEEEEKVEIFLYEIK
jgi:CRISPR/Cas system-associated endonuclease Cas3-HD